MANTSKGLMVWCPLVRDANNQGVSGLKFSGATVATTGGKLGGCYTASNYTSRLISDKKVDLGANQTFCAWFKFTSLNNASQLGGTIVSQHEYQKNTGLGITLKYISSTTGYISCNTGNGSDRTYNTYCGNTLLQANTWYHVAMTYTGGVITFYINGVQDGQHSVGTMSVPSNYIVIGNWATDNNSYGLYGQINDVRVYSYALSQQKIKELSRGIVGHWLGEGNGTFLPNLRPDSYSQNGWGGSYVAQSDGTYKLVANDGWHVVRWILPASYAGKQITISGLGKLLSSETTSTSNNSLWYTNSTGTNPYITGGWDGDTGINANLPEKDKWFRFYKTVTLNTDHQIGIGTYNAPESQGKKTTWLIKNIKIEEGGQPSTYIDPSRPVFLSDISGLERVGSISGTITLSNDTARYDKSMYMNSSASITTSSYSPAHITNGTISWWYKPNNVRNTVMIKGQDVNHYIAAYNSSKFYNNGSGLTAKLYIDGVEKAKSSTSGEAIYYSANMQTGWHHYCLTGVNLSTWTSFNIGGYNSWETDGFVSDIRLYSTALSADDIKELYSLGH